MRKFFSILLIEVIMTLTATLMTACSQVDSQYEEALSCPLTFEVKEPGALYVSLGSRDNASLSYKINDGEMQVFASKHDYIYLNNIGDKVSFYGDHTIPYIKSAKSGCFYVYGNIMSLISSTDFVNAMELTGDDNFINFLSDGHFYSHDTKQLVLPATTLTEKCYERMFAASSITTAPKLPATTLTEGCYASMFIRCESLEVAPELPATTLAKNCYKNMFAGSGLTTAPELPATTLAEGCYSSMFMSTNIKTAPVLPATTLVEDCYREMFSGCSALVYVKCLASDIPNVGCVSRWMKDLSHQDGTFIINNNLSIDNPSDRENTTVSIWGERGVSGIPKAWKVIKESEE